jgi:hypothetical protein
LDLGKRDDGDTGGLECLSGELERCGRRLNGAEEQFGEFRLVGLEHGPRTSRRILNPFATDLLLFLLLLLALSRPQTAHVTEPHEVTLEGLVHGPRAVSGVAWRALVAEDEEVQPDWGGKSGGRRDF